MKKNRMEIPYRTLLPGKDGIIIYETDFPGQCCVGAVPFDYEFPIFAQNTA